MSVLDKIWPGLKETFAKAVKEIKSANQADLMCDITRGHRVPEGVFSGMAKRGWNITILGHEEETILPMVPPITPMTVAPAYTVEVTRFAAEKDGQLEGSELWYADLSVVMGYDRAAAVKACIFEQRQSRFEL